MLFEFELAWQYLSPGGVLVSNHIGWNNAFQTFVADRSPECDLVTLHYNPHRDYDCPGNSGYVVKPDDDGVAGNSRER